MAKQIKRVLDNICEEYGEHTIFQLSDKENLKIDTEKSSTPVDSIIGGGFPRGRITEIFGPEGSGKTTLALKLIAEAQKTGLCAYIDMEHALDLSWAKKIGVNTDELILTQPDYAEAALDILKRLVESQQFSVVVVDSVASLVPRAELEGDIGAANVGLQARLMSQIMRILTTVLIKSNTVVVFINQVRMSIVMFGNPETTPGGLALRFAASVRLRVQRRENKKEGSKIVGITMKAKCVKNKISNPFDETEFTVYFSGEIK